MNVSDTTVQAGHLTTSTISDSDRPTMLTPSTWVTTSHGFNHALSAGDPSKGETIIIPFSEFSIIAPMPSYDQLYISSNESLSTGGKNTVYGSCVTLVIH
jgi:hypothetical protein